MSKRPRPRGPSNAANIFAAAQGAYDAWGRYRPAVQAAGAAWQDFMSASGDKPPGVARPPPVSSLIKNTKLKSYLDKTYAKKCGVEIKRFLSGGVGGVIPTGTLTAIQQIPQNLAIPQNLTDSGRTGNSIEIKSLDFRMTIQSNAGALATTRFRMFAIKVGEVLPGAVPSAAQILNSTTSVRSPLVIKDEQQVPYTVLKEWNVSLAQPGAATNMRQDITWKYQPKGCHAIRWIDADNTGLVANIYSGAIVLYYMFEQIGFATPPSVDYVYELDFTDV